jgi:hypothetical protein
MIAVSGGLAIPGGNIMSKSTWTGALSSDWNDADNWSPAGVPGVNSDVVIASGAPVASASIGTVNSITVSSELSFESAETNTVATFLDNTGFLYVDNNGGEGGTTVDIGGTLTNSHRLAIGNTTLSASDEVTAAALDNTGAILLNGSSTNQALLDVTSGSAGFGATGVLSGYVRLAGDSAIEFVTGEITSLAAGAHLGLHGKNAFIEDSTALGSNSALRGLASIGRGATFKLHSGAAVSTTGALVNDGNVLLDTNAGDGGSSLTLAGALTNSQNLTIGNATLSTSDKVTAASIDNTGAISLTGSSANQALLDVTAGDAGFGTAGVLSGYVRLAGDSAIEFKGGQISTIAAFANLQLLGNNAFIEDSTALGSNSALTGLATIAGVFDLENKAAVSTSGALVNDGQVYLDTVGGGSSLTLAGALTNSQNLNIGNTTLSASDNVTATSLDNTGSINLTGSGADQALLDVTAGSAGFGTAGVLSGGVSLSGDSAIEFNSGQITSVAGSLDLNGNNAFLEDSTTLGSNSALTGLADVAGELLLSNGASLSTIGSVTNSGTISLDYYAPGGSTLSIGGTLTNTNTGRLLVDTGSSGSDKLTAASVDNAGFLFIGGVTSQSLVGVTASFVNSGRVILGGGSGALAALNVLGATTNNGAISIGGSDTAALGGAVGGVGSLSLSGANLHFDSSVSVGQTINESGAGALILDKAQSFAATISGFGSGDTIDATNFLLSGTTFNFVENSVGTGGTLTLTDKSLSLTAKILMTGHYSNSDFALAPDSGTGALVKFV